MRAAYSDYGPHLDLVAPTQVPTTTYGGDYWRNWSGTSAATPHVAGAAALVKAARPGLRPGQVRQLLIQNADDLSGEQNGGREGWDQFTGYGRVNAYEAVKDAKEGRIPPEADITAPDLFSTKRGRFKVRFVAGGHWRLEIGQGEEPAEWRLLEAGTRRVRVGHGGRRASWPTAAGRCGSRPPRAAGSAGEDRAFFYANGDRALKRRLPAAASAAPARRRPCSRT